MNTNHHIPDDILIAYLYHALTDAERETIDAHLLECSECRTRLDHHRESYQRIGREINLALDHAAPPRGMQFDGIAARLQHHSPRSTFPRLADSLPLGAALAGLVLAFVGLWILLPAFSFTQPSQVTSAFPTLACFCLMFVSMDQFDRSYHLRPRYIFSVILATLLWLSTAVLGFLNLVAVRDIALIALIKLGSSPQEADFFTILAVMAAVIGFIVLVIGGAEYHFKNIGHPSSWKVFIWTLAIQLLILITPTFL
jgi:hypothetical protein